MKLPLPSASDDDPSLDRAAELMSLLFDEHISSDEMAELERLALGDPRILRLYVCFAHLQAGLYKYASALGSLGNAGLMTGADADSDSRDIAWMNETMVLPAIAKSLDSEYGPELSTELFPPAPYSPPKQVSTHRYLPRGIAAMLVLAMGALIYLKFSLNSSGPGRLESPQPTQIPVPPFSEAQPPVATVDSVSKPVWPAEFPPPQDGKYPVGRSLLLMSGAVQLGLQDGGRLVLEGPANLQFLSYNRFILRQGKMVAMIPGGGLVVECPNGSVTDLGTEFALDVHPNGGTEVAVFQGSVAAALSSNATTQGSRQSILKVGQAAEIAESSIRPNPQGAIQQRYICNLQNQNLSSLDVTDFLSGGDGSTHRRGLAIDSITGEVGDLSPRGNRSGDGLYHRIQGYPVLDGTFIPDGKLDSMIVNSAGDRFKFVTAGNQTHNLIETGGSIKWNDEAGISTVLDGVDYSKPGHGIICTHSNNALTLDLDAVRRLYPDRQIARFTCRVGNSYINRWHGAAKLNPVSGAFVLVNGKARFEKPRFTNQEGSFSVDLPLTDNDRFLTLAATDANTDIDQQWILWTDPQLSLKATP